MIAGWPQRNAYILASQVLRRHVPKQNVK